MHGTCRRRRHGVFLSTPSARRATKPFPTYELTSSISIHALREEGDIFCGQAVCALVVFLSTPSARRATFSMMFFLSLHTKFLSTPSARRATNQWSVCLDFFCISIHALREEGDAIHSPDCFASESFLSTPSARRATHTSCHRLRPLHISIHALREEGDKLPAVIIFTLIDFYPRPPRGGRRGCAYCSAVPRSISIHALREEGDIGHLDYNAKVKYFYPRPPRGGRHVTRATVSAWKKFLSTPSARRATLISALFDPDYIISIHALREEGD